MGVTSSRIITVSNHERFQSGTLMRAFDEIDQFQTGNIEALDNLLTLQSNIARTLEERGYSFSEEDNEWLYSIK